MTETQQLYHQLLQPSPALITDMKALEGDILLLGVGGKMGPALARLAKQASDKAGTKRRVIGISRFSEPGLQADLAAQGIETIAADLLDDAQLQNLPDAPNLVYLAGTKFGTTGKESLTWAMNSYLPGRVAQRYPNSRIVVFSTGNVYPLSDVLAGGCNEDHLPGPLGEYAQSCLGRERVFQYYGAKNHTPMLIFRLNYANDTRYGILLEIANSVRAQRPVDLSMGHVNVIWQGDANEMALRSLNHCKVPARVLNITGPETVSTRWLATEFGKLFNTKPLFKNEEQPTALLSNAAESFRLFGYPLVPLKRMLILVASWVMEGGETINKPTHFQERQGQF